MMDTEIASLIIFCLFLAVSAALAVVSNRFVRLKERLRRGLDVYRSVEGASEENGRISISELQTVFDSITDGICIIDRKFRVCRVNKSYGEVVRKPMEEATGEECYRLFWSREAPCDECPAAAVFAEGNSVLRRKMVLRVSDQRRHLEISAYPIFDAKRRVSQVIEYVRDSTEEAAMLEQLIRSERLAGIGSMTAGIAHEMNNALSGIAGTASNLLTMTEKFELNEKAANRVVSILDAATRATDVMKNLLQFSDPLLEETRIMLNLKQLVRRIVATVYIKETPDIERRLTFDDSLPPIRADLSKIELILVNIISNAIHSIQEKQSRCAKENVSFKGVLVVSVRWRRDCALVTVTDNGMGIPESIRPKIFDPFFSSWPHVKGTGLGLSTALHFAAEHGGRIFFDSVGDLTTFSIELPLDRKKAALPPLPRVE